MTEQNEQISTELKRQINIGNQELRANSDTKINDFNRQLTDRMNQQQTEIKESIKRFKESLRETGHVPTKCDRFRAFFPAACTAIGVIVIVSYLTFFHMTFTDSLSTKNGEKVNNITIDVVNHLENRIDEFSASISKDNLRVQQKIDQNSQQLQNIVRDNQQVKQQVSQNNQVLQNISKDSQQIKQQTAENTKMLQNISREFNSASRGLASSGHVLLSVAVILVMRRLGFLF